MKTPSTPRSDRPNSASAYPDGRLIDEDCLNWHKILDLITDEYLCKIGASAFAVYDVLKRYANRHTGECFPLMATIQQKSGLSKNTVARCMQVLQESRLLRIEARYDRHGFRQANNYILLKPVPLHTSASQEDVEACRLPQNGEDAGAENGYTSTQNLGGPSSQNLGDPSPQKLGWLNDEPESPEPESPEPESPTVAIAEAELPPIEPVVAAPVNVFAAMPPEETPQKVADPTEDPIMPDWFRSLYANNPASGLTLTWSSWLKALCTEYRDSPAVVKKAWDDMQDQIARRTDSVQRPSSYMRKIVQRLLAEGCAGALLVKAPQLSSLPPAAATEPDPTGSLAQKARDERQAEMAENDIIEKARRECPPEVLRFIEEKAFTDLSDVVRNGPRKAVYEMTLQHGIRCGLIAWAESGFNGLSMRAA